MVRFSIAKCTLHKYCLFWNMKYEWIHLFMHSCIHVFLSSCLYEYYWCNFIFQSVIILRVKYYINIYTEINICTYILINIFCFFFQYFIAGKHIRNAPTHTPWSMDGTTDDYFFSPSLNNNNNNDKKSYIRWKWHIYHFIAASSRVCVHATTNNIVYVVCSYVLYNVYTRKWYFFHRWNAYVYYVYRVCLWVLTWILVRLKWVSVHYSKFELGLL